MSGAMLHGLGDCTAALHCGCMALDLNDVLPYSITCESCGAHEEGERHVSVSEPPRCTGCRDPHPLVDPEGGWR